MEFEIDRFLVHFGRYTISQPEASAQVRSLDHYVHHPGIIMTPYSVLFFLYFFFRIPAMGKSRARYCRGKTGWQTAQVYRLCQTSLFTNICTTSWRQTDDHWMGKYSRCWSSKRKIKRNSTSIDVTKDLCRTVGQ